MSNEPWKVILSKEIEKWLAGLNDRDRAKAINALHRLRMEGVHLSMPYSKPLGDGLLELRFNCEDVQRRITYYFDPVRRAITLTTFRKQRQNERNEVKRASKAMREHKAGGIAQND